MTRAYLQKSMDNGLKTNQEYMSAAAELKALESGSGK